MEFLSRIYQVVWGLPTLLLILLVGLILSWRTGFGQLRLLPKACKMFFRRMLGKTGAGDGVSSFQAVCTALAATVGTGNLAGVAGAIAMGGPGAVFWMWLSGILGMMIKCAEASLAVRYRQRNASGEWIGGTMYMIRNGLPKAWLPLAGTYAFFGVIAAFGVGNATQINTVIVGIEETTAQFGLAFPVWAKAALGLVMAVLLGVLLLGGAKRIGRTAEILVPFAAGMYLLLGILVLILRRDAIVPAFFAIFRGAFQPRAVTGGVVGSFLVTMRTGISRGVFTNEAGMGTAAMAHAGACVRHPVEQGMMGIVEVFLDTIVICTITALVILVSDVPIVYGLDAGIELTTQAFSQVLGSWVSVLISGSLCLFAMATVLGWGLYGLRCIEFLFGQEGRKSFVYLQMLVVLLSTLMSADTVWLLAEIVNGLMAIPNLMSLWVLMPQFISLYKSYIYGGYYENFHQCQSL